MDSIVVNAEIRNSYEVFKKIKHIIVFFFIYLICTISAIKCGVDFRGVYVAVAVLFMVLFIPLTAVFGVWAAKVYHNTWTTRSYVLEATDECVYINGKRLHVNYNSESDLFYVHDLGSFNNPSKASIYMTIEGVDKDRFKEFLQDNMIMIEPEPQIPGISKYRRK